MAEKPVLNNIATNSELNTSQVNENFEILAEKFEDVLGLPGIDETGNTIEGDLDLDGNIIRNGGVPTRPNDLATVSYVVNALSTGSQNGFVGVVVEQTATSGQTLFNFSPLVYSLGTNNLFVTQNGLALTVDTDYTETSTSSITLSAGATAGDKVVFRINSPISTTEDWVINAIEDELDSRSVMVGTNNLSEISSAATSRTNLGLGTSAVRDTGTDENDIPLLGTGGSMPAVSMGAMTFYDEIFIPAGALIPTDTNGAEAGTNEYATNDVMADYYAFDGATEEYVAFNLTMPPGWDRGTLKAKFLWAPGDSACTAADTVEWEIAGVAISDDDTIDTSFGTAQVISDAVHAGKDADLHISAATPAITVGGTPALGDWVQFKISRNVSGTDDMAEDAWLFGVQMQWQRTNTVASW